MRLDLNRGRERGQPWGKKQSELCAQGVPPPPLFIGGGEGGQSWRRRQPLGGRPRVSLPWWRRPRVSPKGALALQVGGATYGPPWSKWLPLTWAFQVREGPLIFNLFY